MTVKTPASACSCCLAACSSDDASCPTVARDFVLIVSASRDLVAIRNRMRDWPVATEPRFVRRTSRAASSRCHGPADLRTTSLRRWLADIDGLSLNCAPPCAASGRDRAALAATRALCPPERAARPRPGHQAPRRRPRPRSARRLRSSATTAAARPFSRVGGDEASRTSRCLRGGARALSDAVGDVVRAVSAPRSSRLPRC